MTFWSNTGEALQRQPDNYYGLQVSKFSLRYEECGSNSSSFPYALHRNTHNLFVLQCCEFGTATCDFEIYLMEGFSGRPPGGERQEWNDCGRIAGVLR